MVGPGLVVIAVVVATSLGETDAEAVLFAGVVEELKFVDPPSDVVRMQLSPNIPPTDVS